MKEAVALLVLVSLAIPSFAVDQAVAMQIAQKNGCFACHALDKKLVGPAWTDVGKKYAGDAGAAQQLAVKVKKGTKGTWGTIPMPPNATVKSSDIDMLVEYILNLKS